MLWMAAIILLVLLDSGTVQIPIASVLGIILVAAMGVYGWLLSNIYNNLRTKDAELGKELHDLRKLVTENDDAIHEKVQENYNEWKDKYYDTTQKIMSKMGELEKSIIIKIKE